MYQKVSGVNRIAPDASKGVRCPASRTRTKGIDMNNLTQKLLDELRAGEPTVSWYRVARNLDVRDQTILNYRHGRTQMADDVAIRACELLGKSKRETQAIVALLAAERAQTEQARQLWKDVVKKLGGVAATALMAIGAATLPSPTQAAPAPISHNANSQYTMYNRRRRSWGAAIAAVSLGLAGCATTIDTHTPPPRDWPMLQVVEHHLAMGDVYATCSRYVPTWMKTLSILTLTPPIVEGCAIVNFRDMRCDIYVRGDIPDAAILEHERLHCQGRDHDRGKATLAAAWRAWKEHMTRPGETYHFRLASGLPGSYSRAR